MNIEKIQDQHCDMTRTTSKRFRVFRNIGEAAKYFPEKEPVLCIGSGDGFEVEAWKFLGFDAMGFEISSAKRKIAAKHGVVSLISLEKLSRKYNVYCAHTIEHVENIREMLSYIKNYCLSTVCLIFPIEPKGSKNPSHLSPVKSIDEIHIDGMRTVIKKERWNDEQEGFIILKRGK